MAEALWLLYNSTVKRVDQRTVNGISAVVMNADDAQSLAATGAEAVAKLQAAGHDVYDGYFDSGFIISDLVAGPLKDDQDLYVIGNLPTQKIEGVA